MAPIDFAMLSSAKETNRYQEVNEDIDKRSHGYKRRKEARMREPEVALQLVKNALELGG